MYLLIVSGLSGAGKSLALHSLEEQGYFCVDNLPSSNPWKPLYDKFATAPRSRLTAENAFFQDLRKALRPISMPYPVPTISSSWTRATMF